MSEIQYPVVLKNAKQDAMNQNRNSAVRKYILYMALSVLLFFIGLSLSLYEYKNPSQNGHQPIVAIGGVFAGFIAFLRNYKQYSIAKKSQRKKENR